MIGSRFQTPFRKLALLYREPFRALVSSVYYFNSFFSLRNRRFGYVAELFWCSADTPLHSLYAMVNEDAAQVMLINHTQSNASRLILYAT